MRLTVLPALCSLVLLAAAATAANPPTTLSQQRYNDLLNAESRAKTFKSIAMLIMALPHERDNVVPQVRNVYWVNHPKVEVSKTKRQMELANLDNKLDRIERVITKHAITRLTLIGFTEVGTTDMIDFYLSAKTSHGPVIFRAPVAFHEQAPPQLFDIKIFNGWVAARQALRDIQHRTTDRVASVSLSPGKAAKQVEQVPATQPAPKSEQ